MLFILLSLAPPRPRPAIEIGIPMVSVLHFDLHFLHEERADPIFKVYLSLANPFILPFLSLLLFKIQFGLTDRRLLRQLLVQWIHRLRVFKLSPRPIVDRPDTMIKRDKQKPIALLSLPLYTRPILLFSQIDKLSKRFPPPARFNLKIKIERSQLGLRMPGLHYCQWTASARKGGLLFYFWELVIIVFGVHFLWGFCWSLKYYRL